MRKIKVWMSKKGRDTLKAQGSETFFFHKKR